MNKLTKFTTEQLQTELLSRQNCQFNKLDCTQQATHYLAKQLGSWVYQKDLICTNCLTQVWSMINK